MKFTVMIPTFDNGPVIRHAIDSVLAQENADLELFVVADGAPEVTLDTVAECAGDDPRVRLFRNPKGDRHGEVWRHEALKQANGEAVCYLCDDDLWFPDHLTTIGRLLEQSDFAHTRMVFLDTDFTVWGIPDSMADPKQRRKMLARRHNICGPTAVGHRLDAYWRLPEGWIPAPPDIWSDLAMWRRWFASESIQYASDLRPTVLHFAKSRRKERTAQQADDEVGYWASVFADPVMRAQLRRMLPDDRTPIRLSDVMRASGTQRRQPRPV